MWFTPTRDTFLDHISIVLVMILALISALSGAWLAVASAAIAFCWILVARIRADTISIQQDTIGLQQRIIDAQRQTMDRMLGPYAQLSGPGEGPS